MAKKTARKKKKSAKKKVVKPTKKSSANSLAARFAAYKQKKQGKEKKSEEKPKKIPKNIPSIDSLKAETPIPPSKKQKKELFSFFKRKKKSSEEHVEKQAAEIAVKEKVEESDHPTDAAAPVEKETDKKLSFREKLKARKERAKQEVEVKKDVSFKHRSLIVMILLMVFTLGFYAIYWLFSTCGELRKKTALAPPRWWMFIPILNIIFLWRYCKALGYVAGANRAVMFILFFFMAPITMLIVQSQLNKIGSPQEKAATSEITQAKVEPKKESAKVATETALKDIKKKKEKPELTKKQRLQRLREYALKAGFEIEPKLLIRRLIIALVVIHLFASFYVLYNFVQEGAIVEWSTVLRNFAAIWIVSFSAMFILFWVLFFFVVDVQIYNRRKQIEDVLPDFLQLTASNIKAGMTIDRALWYAVRPRFGVLAKEIEMVAKENMAGVELQTALLKFTKRYDSPLTTRAISLLIEGMDSGGEIGDLLTKIATNIENQKIMVTEMAANVTTYIIFISFAAIVAAPGLFALSGTLVQVLQQIAGSVDLAPSSGSSISISGSGVDIGEFKIFAITSLMVTATLSAMLVSVIKKGNVKSGLKNIPIFNLVSLSLYFGASFLTDKMVSLFL